MTIKKFLMSLVCLTLVTFAGAHPHHDEEPNDWIPQAELRQLFPKATNFVAKHLSNPAEFALKVNQRLKPGLSDDELATPMFTALQGGKPVGHAWAGLGNFKAGSALVIVAVDGSDRITG